MIKNKRGFELAVNTVVLMILAIVVLLVLVGFFMFGSSDFMSKIKGYFSYSNIDSVRQGCEVLANSGQVNSFCCDVKNVKYYEDGKQEDGMTCSEMAEKGLIEVDMNCEGEC